MTVDSNDQTIDQLTEKESIIYQYAVDQFKNHQSYAHYISKNQMTLAESMAHSYGMQKVKTYRYWCRPANHGGNYYPEFHHFRAEYDRVIAEWYLKNAKDKRKP